jgi:hypothetical protein|tara:strand:- start:1032 stop:1238 length:207 start_codon:yes stop_codon:yes gene_type:complete
LPKIQEYKGRFFVTLPKDLVEQKDWKKGQRVNLMFNERGNVELCGIKSREVVKQNENTIRSKIPFMDR